MANTGQVCAWFLFFPGVGGGGVCKFTRNSAGKRLVIFIGSCCCLEEKSAAILGKLLVVKFIWKSTALQCELTYARLAKKNTVRRLHSDLVAGRQS